MKHGDRPARRPRRHRLHPHAVDLTGLQASAVFSEPAVPVVPATQRLADKESVSLADLDDEQPAPACLHSAANEVRLAWASYRRTPLIAKFVLLAEATARDAQTNPTT